MEEMTGKPFVLIGVNSDPIERAKKAVAENELQWRNFWAGPQATRGPIPDAWGVTGWPTIIVLDADMRIQYRGHDGNKATKVAEALVEKLVAGQEGKQ
ncbi:MAG: hypothetical protein H6832_15970 [Planctomycetes bacterium]|nr:hypothetical protein [Planctomycetota bacterium]